MKHRALAIVGACLVALAAPPASAQNLFDRLGDAVRELTEPERGARQVRQPDPARAERREIQRQLNALGYEAGPDDGIAGARTRAAISAFQTDITAPATGELTATQAETLATMASARAGEAEPGAQTPQTAQEGQEGGEDAETGTGQTPPEPAPADAQSLAESRPRETPLRPGFTDCEGCPEMVSLPAGRFMMGATDAEADMELISDDISAQPRHQVEIPYRFALSRHEITTAQFDAYVRETGAQSGGLCGIRLIETGPNAQKYQGTLHPDTSREVLGPFFVYITDGSYAQPGLAITPQQPAVCISRNEAEAYLDWLSGKTGKPYRLPTEAEWEYAARAGTQTIAFWGDDLAQACAYANFGDSASGYQAGFVAPCAEHITPEWTAAVGQYRPNPWGLYDMAGNVQEMTQDCWAENYEGAPADGSPRLDEACQMFVARGGDYELLHVSMRASERLFYGRSDTTSAIHAQMDGHDFRANVLGFRAAMSLDQTAWDLAPAQ